MIGCEYAGTFAALGTEVHLVDGRDTLLPFLDREISRGLAAAMAENGIRFHWQTKVLECDTSGSGDVTIRFSTGETLDCDGVLVCAGRSSNTQSINVSAAGLTLGARGLIQVGPGYRSTEVEHIYAAGDVIGAPALAATGIEQARIAVCHAFNAQWACGLAPLLPTGIYTIPEVSYVGDTEEALIARKIPYVVGRCRYSEIPRGDIIGDHLGFLKLLFHREDMRLLGVHVMGEQATEVVHLGLIAMTMHATAELFHQVCFKLPYAWRSLQIRHTRCHAQATPINGVRSRPREKFKKKLKLPATHFAIARQLIWRTEFLTAKFACSFGGWTEMTDVMLRRGSKGSEVVRLQTMLNRELNLAPPLALDGDFGPKTEAAVRKFQAAHHLVVDGIVGPKTWGALHANFRKPAPGQSPGAPPTQSSGGANHGLIETAVKLAMTQVGVMEHPLGSNRGAEVDAYNQRAGAPLGSFLVHVFCLLVFRSRFQATRRNESHAQDRRL